MTEHPSQERLPDYGPALRLRAAAAWFLHHLRRLPAWLRYLLALLLADRLAGAVGAALTRWLITLAWPDGQAGIGALGVVVLHLGLAAAAAGSLLLAARMFELERPRRLALGFAVLTLTWLVLMWRAAPSGDPDAAGAFRALALVSAQGMLLGSVAAATLWTWQNRRARRAINAAASGPR